MSSSSSNEMEELEERLDEVFEDICEDTINNIIEAQTKKQKKRAYIDRNREAGHIRLWNDYFSENLTYEEHIFRRRFRNREAIRMLSYGSAVDAVDKYLRLEDLQRLLDIGEKRGFPGMIESIDCMHWEWKNCPTTWKGQYARGSNKPTIVLEVVASQDLWIWHAFFGPPGTLNDTNVLDRSPVFDDIIEGRTPRLEYVVNGHKYKLAYYLTDGIYPKWSTFIQSISRPQGLKARLFAKKQEAARKDVERAFGVLQARFAIVKNPALTWDKKKIGKIMRACIIIYNMIV
ncbi:uncharacterized protein LOC130499003 [Raphanus sativus]|uniref:Uncharacterized protein LOC130499003 n=1 Tax=Raphanus sativus TaxID=3726 RepID=A0A9W3CBL3_RAPSA|nr:uncharacterized protein LOC130499003 [Raphanus sativus]